MKICVPVKWVIDSLNPVKVMQDGHHICMDNMNMIMDTLSQSALARAVALKTDRIATSVVAVTVGDSNAESVLRSALAMGADTAIHILDKSDGDVDIVKSIAHIIETHHIDLILCGTHATDSDNGQMGAMIASHLNMPYVACATQVDINADKVHITSVYNNTQVEYVYNTPMVIGCNTQVATPKQPVLPRALYVKNKPIETRRGTPPIDMASIQVMSLQNAMESAQGATPIDTQALFAILTNGGQS